MTAHTLSAVAEVRRVRSELAELRRLVSDLLAAQDPEAEIAYRRALCAAAYGQGQEHAWSEGYAAAIADIKRAEHETVDAIRRAGRRATPGGEAWLDAVERHGGTEYGGAGQPRVPVPPKTVALARETVPGYRKPRAA